MLLTCPICHAACTVDHQSVDTVTCPTCGQQLSTRTGTPVEAVGAGDTPAPDAMTGDFDAAAVRRLVDHFDVLPVRMGRYTIESTIAQGGFAKVYLATDEALGRRVAIKIPRLEKFQSPEKLDLFLAEARTAAKLRHPGIVMIFDVGRFDNGVNYIAMEYVAGKTLAQLMDAGPIPIPRAVELLVKISEAVHYAHGQGLVHRDLKPGNVLIDERGEPRVVDFGLAVHETAQNRLKGEVAGTPPYMSPEQFRGEVHRLDGRSDIWSLGVVLYQLLTGRRPFNGHTSQLYDEVLHKAPKPPRQIDDLIPRDLESICFKCLSKSVDDRYTTAKDLADDLNGWMSNSKIESVEIIPHPPQPPRIRRRTAGIATLLAGVTLAVLFAIVVGMKSPKSAFDLDKRAIRDEWTPVLDAKLVPLVLDSNRETESWSQNRHKVTVDSSGDTLLSLGESSATDFVVQVMIGRNVWASSQGQAGLFLGWQPIEDATGNKGHRCVVITVLSDKEGADFISRLHIQPWDVIDETDSSNRHIQKRQGKTVRIPTLEPQNLLEIQVSRGVISSVKWQNVNFSEMVVDMDLPEVAPAGSKSQIGVINVDGAASFSDVRFKFLK